MNRKIFYTIFTALLICCSVFASSAQNGETISAKKAHKFALYGGIGPNFYFNNLVVAKQKVNELNYSVVGRLMWEPENNLSLGIESGYYRLYTVDAGVIINNVGYGSIRIVNSSVPIQLVVTMKFFEDFYGGFSFGRAILLNKVSTTEHGSFNASSGSFGDYTFTAGYKRLINDRISVGAEIKSYFSGKLYDKNIALVFMGGFRF